jgi:hypothetical protein
MSDYETLEDEASSDAQWQTSEIRSAKPNWSSFAQSKLISEAYAPCQSPLQNTFPPPGELPAARTVSAACSLPRGRARGSPPSSRDRPRCSVGVGALKFVEADIQLAFCSLLSLACVRACMRACVRACVRAFLPACVRACACATETPRHWEISPASPSNRKVIVCVKARTVDMAAVGFMN